MGTSLPHFLLHQICHLDSECFQKFLQEFSQTYPGSKHILQLDNGPLHTAKNLKVPENIVLLFQPPHCPELNPIERVWEYLKSFLRWELFSHLDELKAQVREILRSLTTTIIASLAGWDYILQALSVAGV